MVEHRPGYFRLPGGIVQQYLLFVLIGLGAGSIYAALATGIVTIYRGTGIINFAAGAMGMWS
ncbi:MAG: hypothetical protein RL119_563, partial [Actinomycetota bacterium]